MNFLRKINGQKTIIKEKKFFFNYEEFQIVWEKDDKLWMYLYPI